MIEVGRRRAELLLTLRTPLLLTKGWNPVLSVEAGIVDKSIRLSPCFKGATRNGALETDPCIGVDNLLVEKVIIGSHLNLIAFRVNCRHVMEEG